MKICVFEIAGCYPKRVSKQRAKRLVASGQYRWNGAQAIQAIPPQPKSAIALRFTYIPEKMPPLEVPGTYFEAPGKKWLVVTTKREKTFKDRSYPEPIYGANP